MESIFLFQIVHSIFYGVNFPISGSQFIFYGVNLSGSFSIIIAKDPDNFIYSYFSKEKNKIDLKRETLISKINDISDEMIDKIKQM